MFRTKKFKKEIEELKTEISKKNFQLSNLREQVENLQEYPLFIIEEMDVIDDSSHQTVRKMQSSNEFGLGYKVLESQLYVYQYLNKEQANRFLVGLFPACHPVVTSLKKLPN